jgi:serine/threonine protein kinase/tetratricopeptide (TPR) repeat protein
MGQERFERVGGLPAQNPDALELPATMMIRRFQPSELIGNRFEIVTFIGGGGMGDVYEAKDLQLGGHVALKTIRPQAASDERMIARFKHEINLAKRVTHPNVCRIHDVGFHSEPHGQDDRSGDQLSLPVKMFLTMELLPGETLSARIRKGPMNPSEALPIVNQLAAGLNAAHQAGVVHGDFKSGNVVLVPSNNAGTRAVITDFGLARNFHPMGDATTVSLTQAGKIAGTPEYMAPEQVVGDVITPPVDIYALGIVMYEMLTGKRPFDAESPIASAVKRLHENPPSPRKYVADLDRRWEAVILRCLERQPSQRFASAAEVVQALVDSGMPRRPVQTAPTRRLFVYTGLGSAGAIAGSVILWRVLDKNTKQSIAILPFTNIDSTLEYVSDGITDDLINILGQRATLRVMSRAAVYPYKGSNPVPQQLGRTLHVGNLLTGRVAKKGDYVSVRIELTETTNGVHLWGQQYERRISEIPAVEEDISREVLNRLQLQFGPDEQKRLASRRSINPEANEFYWRGRYFWNKRTQEGFKKALEYFNQAIDKDPGFAPAYTGLADCYAMQSGILPPLEVFPKAKAAAVKALQLDDALAEAHASLGFAHLFFDWDWPQTVKEYTRAIQLNTNYASAHSIYGMYLVVTKQFDEALAEMKRALELDPASVAINTGVGRVLFYARKYRDAAAQYRKTLEMNPDFSEALFDLGKTFTAQGKYNEAVLMLERGLEVAGEDAGAIAQIAYVHRRAGRKPNAEMAVQSLQSLSTKRYVSPYFFAVAQLGASDEAALDSLEKAYQDRSFSIIYLDVDSRFDPLRSQPRYRRLLQRLGLPLTSGARGV